MAESPPQVHAAVRFSYTRRLRLSRVPIKIKFDFDFANQAATIYELKAGEIRSLAWRTWAAAQTAS